MSNYTEENKKSIYTNNEIVNSKQRSLFIPVYNLPKQGEANFIYVTFSDSTNRAYGYIWENNQWYILGGNNYVNYEDYLW